MITILLLALAILLFAICYLSVEFFEKSKYDCTIYHFNRRFRVFDLRINQTRKVLKMNF